jgi:hypothetical protein
MNRAFGAAALFPQHIRNPRKCPRGKHLRKLISSLEKEFRSERETAEAVARSPLINDGKAYCIARCGGCELTVGWWPPA